MWELQPKTLYTFLSATEKTIKEKPQIVQAVVSANIEATRIMYTDRAKIIPILVKRTGYPEKVLAESFDFLVKQCIWDANSGLSCERVNFTAQLMTKVGNIKPGKTPKYEDVVDTSFAKKAIEQLGKWKGPVCPTVPAPAMIALKNTMDWFETPCGSAGSSRPPSTARSSGTTRS